MIEIPLSEVDHQYKNVALSIVTFDEIEIFKMIKQH